ncbi:hypothetical protein [Mangrovibacillus cuniculi]|uniref:Uncharacterized protein n=1 Tax=Mangrovibacillus cuniculi TaxID=2593652 RepID=A0A7S8HEK2_9BACI|nr:hypothetical protein [Mangrovibacillus cuniculi]QPC45576.1 hypothetical protein G8O30_00585 [Mangrovibacillus cuniculi]
MERTKRYRRHHRNRVIRNKLYVVKQVWGIVEEDEHRWVVEPGRLSKQHLNCSCYMCKYEKVVKLPKSQYKSKLDAMEREI